MSEEKTFRQLSQRIEGLVARIETIADPNARANALDLTQALMELHGAGLEHLMEIVARGGDPGYAMMDDFANDDLVASLLLLYGLHPHDLETRVLNALDRSRPFLHSHGGDVEFLGVDEGVVKLRLEGSCRSCPSSTVTLKQAIESAIYDAAPDVTEIVTEGVANSEASALPNGLVQLKGSSNNLSNKHGFDQCVSVGTPERGILHSTVKGESHG
jgi:Fe-S cluster biogenesis protein NfuA